MLVVAKINVSKDFKSDWMTREERMFALDVFNVELVFQY